MVALQIIRAMDQCPRGVWDKELFFIKSVLCNRGYVLPQSLFTKFMESFLICEGEPVANAFFKEKENDGLSGYRVWEEGNTANNPFPLPPLPPESIPTQYESLLVTVSVTVIFRK